MTDVRRDGIDDLGVLIGALGAVMVVTMFVKALVARLDDASTVRTANLSSLEIVEDILVHIRVDNGIAVLTVILTTHGIVPFRENQ